MISDDLGFSRPILLEILPLDMIMTTISEEIITKR